MFELSQPYVCSWLIKGQLLITALSKLMNTRFGAGCFEEKARSINPSVAAQDPVTARQLSRSNARLLSRQGGSVSLTTQGSPRDLLSFFFLRFFLRDGKGGKKRGREKSMCGCLSHGSHWGPRLQPWNVPRLGIEPVTLRFAAHAQSTELHHLLGIF